MRRALAAAALCALAACVQPPPSAPAPSAAEIAARQAAEAAALEQAAQQARVAEAARIAEDAYLYGYPLLVGEQHRLALTEAAQRFQHQRRAPPAGAPHPWIEDADTLLSVAWLDLGREAVLFVLPDMGRRWFAFNLHSLWMPTLWSVHSGGGDARGTRVLLAGPEWQGNVPPGVRLVRSPTRHALLLGRIQIRGGDADLRAVHALQNRLRLLPQPPRTGVDSGAGSRAASIAGPLQALDIGTYFDRLARLLGSAAPPAPADAPLLEAMARIGLEPGKPFRLDALEPAVQQALRQIPARAAQRLAAYRPQLFHGAYGWQALRDPGDLGTDVLRRAALAAVAWPGPQPRQRLEMSTRVDADGQALRGVHDYLLRFAAGAQPPVQGFWSLTLQAEDAQGRRSFVPDGSGRSDRIGLGSRDRLPLAADGALELIVQNLSPGPQDAARWLPAPKGGFVLTLCLYGPRQPGWWPPPPRRVD